jgi:APA family basic amino acid/polyamine antiporter
VTDDPPSAGPAFGLATATFLVVSGMIGTGVLTTSGFTVFFVGSNQLMLALWVVGGVLAVCGALTLCELTTTLPNSGGDYVYLREAYGPLPAFLSGWVSFLIGFGGPIAASAAAAAHYLLAPAALSEPAAGVIRAAIASAAIVAITGIHCLGRRSSMLAQATMTLVKLAIIVALAAAGLAAGQGSWAHLADRPPLSFDLVLPMASSLVYISYAYTGWNTAAYVAGEVREPQVTMPRAILLGTSLVVVVYLALNTAYALALSAADIRTLVDRAGSVEAVAPIAQLMAARLFGPAVATPLSIALGLTLLASVSAYAMTGPRVAAAMAHDGLFPAAAGRLSDRGVPVVAAAWQGAWALLLVWTASFERILVFAGVGLALSSMLAVAAVFVLRRRPDLPRPFRTPGYPFVPAVYLLGTGLLTAAVIAQRPLESGLCLASIAGGIPLYYAAKRRPRR